MPLFYISTYEIVNKMCSSFVVEIILKVIILS